MKRLIAKQSAFQWPNVSAPTETREASLGIRLMWMVGIWVASVSLLLLIAFILRWVLQQTQ